MNRDIKVGDFFLANVAHLVQFRVHTLYVFVKVKGSYELATMGTLGCFIVVHHSYMPSVVAHTKLLSTNGAGLLFVLMKLFYMPAEVVHTDVLFTIWTVDLFLEVVTLHMEIQTSL